MKNLSLIAKSLVIFVIGMIIRIDPEHYYASTVAWTSFIFALVWLDDEKPWDYRANFLKITSHSSVFFYCVIIYILAFHYHIEVWWWQR